LLTGIFSQTVGGGPAGGILALMAGDYQLWIDDSGGPPPPPDQQPRGPRWSRWIALVAGFAALLALIAVQHFTGSAPRADTAPSPSVTQPPSTSPPPTPTPTSSTASRTSPFTPTLPPTTPVTATTSGEYSLPGQRWELVGFQWSGAAGGGSAVVRYRPDTGELITTPIPPLSSSGPFSFVATGNAAIIRPMDFVNGYVIPDGRPAAVAAGPLLSGGGQPILPSADPNLVWVPTVDGTEISIVRTDSAGHAQGAALKPPASLTSTGMLTPDGAGGVLFGAVGGVFDLRPGEARLVTHGAVLAAGPTGYLVYECDESARCGAAVVDHATHRHTPLHSDLPAAGFLGQIQGVISPNGRYAAIIDFSQGPRLIVVDLRSGAWTPVGDSLNSRAPMWGDASPVVAFTPDSGTLLMAAAGGVDVVSPSSGEVLGRLPLPPLAAMALRLVG
jgi:hypothetical protein